MGSRDGMTHNEQPTKLEEEGTDGAAGRDDVNVLDGSPWLTDDAETGGGGLAR